MTDATMHEREVTAFFDSRADAQDASDRLVASGISAARIRMVEGNETASAGTTAAKADEDKGFFEKLGDFFMPDEDRETYAEGLRRGGYVVSVATTPDEYDQVIDILDDEGTVNLDERSETWRSDGWTGTTGMATTGAALGGAGMGTTAPADMGTTTPAAMTDADMARGTGDASVAPPMASADLGTRMSADGDTLQVAEERLRVGKRDVSHGRVRIRSYTVETPVSEDVHLHQERVEVERRPVDRALTDGDTAFADRTIEAEESVQEAVVSKEARVTEEISLRKTSEDEVEHVEDTVRKTEVDVDDDRTGATGTRTTIDRDRT